MEHVLASNAAWPREVPSGARRFIGVFHRQTRWLGHGDIQRLAAAVGVEGRLVESDDRLLVGDGARSLAYLQPPARLAGQLLLSDRTPAAGAAVRAPLDAGHATRLARELLERWGVPPAGTPDGPTHFDLEATGSDVAAARDTGGGEPASAGGAVTQVVGRIRLDGLPVVGPRGEVRLTFGAEARPRRVRVALWESLRLHEERQLVSPHEALHTAVGRLLGRADVLGRPVEVREIRLVYFADEYRGGADLLVPEYLVAVEHGGDARSRQVLRVPAWR
jgi:hypothetical protein